MHLHGVKLHPVAGASIYCYIFGMMNLFKLFLKPFNIASLDDMRLSDIMTPNGPVPVKNAQIQIDASGTGSIVLSPEAPNGNIG